LCIPSYASVKIRAVRIGRVRAFFFAACAAKYN
jgi:hypothetical protein